MKGGGKTGYRQSETGAGWYPGPSTAANVSEEIRVLLVGEDLELLQAIQAVLACDSRFLVAVCRSAARARELLSSQAIEVVVAAPELTDMTGLDFLKEAVPRYPQLNCALVSPLYPDEFHRDTEGLGLFMQLPERPGIPEIKQLAERIQTIVRRQHEVSSS